MVRLHTLDHIAPRTGLVSLSAFTPTRTVTSILNGVDIANYIGEEIDVEEDALKPWYNSVNGALDILEYSNEENVCITCRKGVSASYLLIHAIPFFWVKNELICFSFTITITLF